MNVIWHEDAKRGRLQVSNYIRKHFGYRRMKVFIQEVGEQVRALKQYPNIGAIDSLFADRSEEYRSVIIGGLSKMVYLIGTDTIHIVGFWDCRQEPENQATHIGETNEIEK